MAPIYLKGQDIEEPTQKTDVENITHKNGSDVDRIDDLIEKSKEVLSLVAGMTYKDAYYVLGYAQSSLSEIAIVNSF